MPTAVITGDGAVHVPKSILDSLHWEPGTEVEFRETATGIEMTRLNSAVIDWDKFEEIRKRICYDGETARRMIEEGRSEC